MIFTAVNDSPRHLFLIDSGASINLINKELATEVIKVHGNDDTVVHGTQGRTCREPTASL